MATTYEPVSTSTMTVGDKGRVVIPASIREAHGWGVGTKLIAIETEDGLLVMSLDEALAWMRARLQAHYVGRDVVQELIDERRAEVERERQEVGE